MATVIALKDAKILVARKTGSVRQTFPEEGQAATFAGFFPADVSVWVIRKLFNNISVKSLTLMSSVEKQVLRKEICGDTTYVALS